MIGTNKIIKWGEWVLGKNGKKSGCSCITPSNFRQTAKVSDITLHRRHGRQDQIKFLKKLKHFDRKVIHLPFFESNSIARVTTSQTFGPFPTPIF